MSVYLGNEGEVELQRVETGRGLRSELAPSDVNVARKRFSVDFALGALITGDLITIATDDGSTSRELVQTTSLSEEFQSQYEAGLISGQGRMSCFWEHQYALCNDISSNSNSDTLEFSVYLARLVLRLQQGARFRGKFYIFSFSKLSIKVVEFS